MNEEVNLSKISNLILNYFKKNSSEDSTCQIGYKELAKKLKISRTSVILGIKELVWVNRVKKLPPPYPNPDNLPNIYILL